MIDKPIASVENSDVEFLTPADNDTYFDLNTILYTQGKLTKPDGGNLDKKDFKVVTNNILHLLFTQCSIILNDVAIMQATDLYNYRPFLKTILTYVSVGGALHLTKSF